MQLTDSGSLESWTRFPPRFNLAARIWFSYLHTSPSKTLKFTTKLYLSCRGLQYTQRILPHQCFALVWDQLQTWLTRCHYFQEPSPFMSDWCDLFEIAPPKKSVFSFESLQLCKPGMSVFHWQNFLLDLTFHYQCSNHPLLSLSPVCHGSSAFYSWHFIFLL